MNTNTNQCAICGHHTNNHTCNQCQTNLDTTLVNIADLYSQLPAEFEPGRASGERITHAFQASMPIRVDPLDLSLPVPSGKARTAAVHDDYGDQTGHIPVAIELDMWVRDWREYRSRKECQPQPVVSTLISWLRNRIDWAVTDYPAVGEFAVAMQQVRSTLRLVLGQTKPRDEVLSTPCRECNLLTLLRPVGDERVYCANEDCGLILTADEYQRWVGLLAAKMRKSA